eukprot:3740259-Prorocentrum_lima.AAC.1
MGQLEEGCMGRRNLEQHMGPNVQTKEEGAQLPGRVSMQRTLICLPVNTHRPHVDQDLTTPRGSASSQ